MLGGWRWMASPAQKTRPMLQVRRVHLVVAPQRVAGDLDVQVGHAQQVADDLRRRGVVDRGRLIVDVVAPHDRATRPTAAPCAPGRRRCRRRWSPAASPSTGPTGGGRRSAAMSALKVMFIDPAMSIAPSNGRSMSAATLERAPSAPIRYLARIVYSMAGEPVQDIARRRRRRPAVRRGIRWRTGSGCRARSRCGPGSAPGRSAGCRR